MVTREHLETLVQLSQSFNSTIDLDPLLHRILDLTLSVTEAEAGALWIVEDESLRCTHAAGPARDSLLGQTRPVSEGALGEALRTGAAVVVADALDDERYADYRDGTFRTRSAVTIPLVSVDGTLGVIELVNDVGGKDEFAPEDVAFLEMLADDAAAALRNARLFEAERRARNLKALLEVSHEVTTTFDLERLLFSIVNLAGRAVRFERCALAVWEGEELQLRAISGEAHVDRKATLVRDLERFLTWVAGRAEPLVLPDTAADDDTARTVRRSFDDYLAASRARGVLVLPIADAEGEIGQILFEFAEPGMLDEWTREAAGLLANQAALSIRNAQLYAGVPFISWLEPLAQKRRALMALPGRAWLRYAAAAVALLLVLGFVRLPLRVTAADAAIHAAVQRPARAGVAGTIAEIHVREGEAVTTGQLVATLRSDALQLRLVEAEGELRLAEREALAAEAAGSAAGAAAARQRATQLRSALALLREEANLLRVTAPASGIVLTPLLEERVGSYRLAGEPVLWIGDRDSAEIRLRVRQQDVAEIVERDRVRVRVAARPELRFDGVVATIAPLADLEGGNAYYTVRAILDNTEGVLRPGMTARARVLTQPQPVGYLLLRRPWRFLRMHLWW
jgi:GAF domain-containing protein/multidrug efflux pump subunit AcrA (membrane-fusion protein)